MLDRKASVMIKLGPTIGCGQNYIAMIVIQKFPAIRTPQKVVLSSTLSGPSTINSLPQIFEHSTLTATFWVVSFAAMLFNNSVFSLSNWDNSMFAFGQTSKYAEK